MSPRLHVAAYFVLLLSAHTPAGELTRGDVVFKCDFKTPDALKGWSLSDGKKVSLATGRENAQVLSIQQPETGSVNARLPLNVEQLRGARLKFQAMVKAENVAKPPQAWNGVKFMLHVTAPGGPQWIQQNSIHGTFEWKSVGFSCRIPQDATQAELVLGIENTSGQAWFDEIKVTVMQPARTHRVGTAGTEAGATIYKGHNLARLRGAMINPKASEADLRTFGSEWKANVIRWQLCWNGFPRSPADNGDLPAYDTWLEGQLQHVDKLLPVCKEAGLLVVIDLHTPPGGRDDANDCRLFQEKRFQDKFIEVWEKMAKRYRGNEIVWGYDLLNEPCEGNIAEGLMDWQALVTRAAQIVRREDPDHAIIVEPAPWGGPEAIENLEPIPVEKVVYSVHMYLPHQFTHQGVHGNPVGISYPGKIGNKEWDKAQLRVTLDPVRRFQREHNVHVYLGEFSAIRWAPGDSARDYLRDCIDLFEEYGWDWSYHAFREWDGWSVEHGSDPKDHKPSAAPTDRQKLLQSWFAKNEKPWK
ncbi:MAG TPA: glycoside hydrolase family 5 protein [Planctomycetota bacterium]|jgi:hypothetical protein